MKEFEKEPVLVRLADMETRFFFLWQQSRLNDGKGKKYVETQSLLQQKYTESLDKCFCNENGKCKFYELFAVGKNCMIF